MATVVLFDDFGYNLGIGAFNLGSDTFRVALTNTAPTQDTGSVLADITQISAGNGYTQVADGAGATLTMAWAETSSGSGVWRFGNSSSDVVFTASGGSIGPFRYVVLVDDTSTSNKLVGYLDYGTAVTITDTNTFTIDTGTNGWFELTIP